MLKALDSKNLKVRFIRLGEGNSYAKHCIDNSVSILGFWSGEEAILPSCVSNDWDVVKEFLIKKRTVQKNGIPPRSVADDLRQVKEFFSDQNGETLWITLYEGHMYWALSDSNNYMPIPFDTTIRCSRHMTTPWSRKTLTGKSLAILDLNESVAKLQGYRGTICAVRDPEHVIRLIKA